MVIHLCGFAFIYDYLYLNKNCTACGNGNCICLYRAVFAERVNCLSALCIICIDSYGLIGRIDEHINRLIVAVSLVYQRITVTADKLKG